MKKLFILIVATVTMSCSKESISECACEIEGIRMISFDKGNTWHFNQVDNRSGEILPCDYNGKETNQVYEETYWYKTVWTCK